MTWSQWLTGSLTFAHGSRWRSITMVLIYDSASLHCTMDMLTHIAHGSFWLTRYCFATRIRCIDHEHGSRWLTAPALRCIAPRTWNIAHSFNSPRLVTLHIACSIMQSRCTGIEPHFAHCTLCAPSQNHIWLYNWLRCIAPMQSLPASHCARRAPTQSYSFANWFRYIALTRLDSSHCARLALKRTQLYCFATGFVTLHSGQTWLTQIAPMLRLAYSRCERLTLQPN